MKQGKVTGGVFAVIWVLFAAIMYYVMLPALNLHSVGLWFYVVFVCLLPVFLLILLHRCIYEKEYRKPQRGGALAVIGIAMFAVVVLFLLCLLFGAQMFNANKYASILKTETYDFKDDIGQPSTLSKIALMDTDSAILLGNREIGGLSEVVSQFNVSDDYSQIDLKGTPQKVSALGYAGLFKYFGNKKEGTPGYVMVDPVGQSAEYVKLDQGMKYVPTAYFSQDLRRHLRMKYPTKIFDNLHFEVDEEGNPYYVASVYRYTISLFGGQTVAGAIVCNPIDGSCEYYDVASIPNWVDNAFDGDLLIEQYNWYGKLNNGFWNSLFGKKGCKKCTETKNTASGDTEDDEDSYAPDFGYVSKDGDIWIYTGVTSVNDDASNIGFILVNERTGEAHYFDIAGADENSAMSAAQGEVQEKGYVASFPSLINVDDQSTYVMVLKDASGIVKLYAMVNVESYNIVTTASTLDECFQKYRQKLGTGGDESKEEQSEENKVEYKDEDKVEADIVVEQIQYLDKDGNTYVYLIAADGNVYKQKFADNEQLVFVKEGDSLHVTCVEQETHIFQILQIDGIFQ